MRCKCCDTQFNPRWNKKREEFEDLCDKCLPAALDAAASPNYTESVHNYKFLAKRIMPDE